MQTARLRKQWFIAICLFLAVGTLALYWPTRHDAFINFDDDAYVTGNSHVKHGLTWAGVVWAFKSGYAANWHPLTWISHMTDCQLFGLNPAGHHLMNALFHAANAVLLFILLRYMTGALWRSAFAAALFAWHPLRVESVAWASERKDVLSAFFWMLTLLCYARYAKSSSVSAHNDRMAPSLDPDPLLASGMGVESKPPLRAFVRPEADLQDPGKAKPLLVSHPGPRKSASAVPQSATRGSNLYYCLALLCFVCGLLSKPMVVTLPFICLLLDFWPLQRFQTTSLRRLILEKLPFFALSAVECVITYLVQKHGGAVVVNDPLSFRVSNALWAYERYIAKTFWPTHLSIVYPYVHGGLAILAIGSALLLAVCSIAFIGLSRRWPYLFTGWFWFLGALVPVIGFVEIGPASMADRYTYLPDIGLVVLATWAMAGLLRRQRMIAGAIGILALAACVVLTSIQIRYWRNSITLFRHAIAVTKDNAVACACLGQALEVAGHEGEALTYCRNAVRIDPVYPAGQFFLGQVLWKLGNPRQALPHLQTAARSAPDNPDFQYNLGKFLLEHGQTNDAIVRFKAALNDEPDFPEAHNALGKAFLKQGVFPKAMDQLSQAARLEPGNAQFHYDLGTVLLTQSSPARAIAQFTQAIRLKPDFALAQENLAVALAGQGDMAGAMDHFARAVELQPNDPEAHFNFGFARLNNHQPAEAAKQFQEELRLTPNVPKAHYRLAQALRAQNDLPQALSQYRETLELAPDFVAARREMDEILAAHPGLR